MHENKLGINDANHLIVVYSIAEFMANKTAQEIFSNDAKYFLKNLYKSKKSLTYLTEVEARKSMPLSLKITSNIDDTVIMHLDFKTKKISRGWITGCVAQLSERLK